MSFKGPLTAKAIGARFRSARSLVPQLNRKSFCDKHEINRYTMQSWENGLHISKGGGTGRNLSMPWPKKEFLAQVTGFLKVWASQPAPLLMISKAKMAKK